MSGNVISAAILAVAFGAAPAFADLKGPAELPPAGYKGQQYVDSRGCVFLRAGYGDQINWVPRVSRSGSERVQLCGYPSSGGAVEVAEEVAPAPMPAPAPAPKVVAAPPAAVAAAPVVSRPVTPTKQAATAKVSGTVVSPGGGSGYQLACPADTPVAQRFEIYGGGSKVLCTKGDGSLVGANFPTMVAGSTAGHAIGYDAYAGTAATGYEAPAGVASKSTKSAKYPEVAPPPGYKLAWDDGRLNPNRGKQTVEGFLAMDEMWTRTTPSELREDSKVKRKKVTVVIRRADGTQVVREGLVSEDGSGKRTVEVISGGNYGTVTVSTKSEPKAVVKPKAETPAVKAPVKASGKLMVAVGSFGVVSNADGAAGKLKAMGLPVARGKAKGGALQVIYAGPFASAAEAKAALASARRAGFSDAVIVQ